MTYPEAVIQAKSGHRITRHGKPGWLQYNPNKRWLALNGVNAAGEQTSAPWVETEEDATATDWELYGDESVATIVATVGAVRNFSIDGFEMVNGQERPITMYIVEDGTGAFKMIGSGTRRDPMHAQIEILNVQLAGSYEREQSLLRSQQQWMERALKAEAQLLTDRVAPNEAKPDDPH